MPAYKLGSYFPHTLSVSIHKVDLVQITGPILAPKWSSKLKFIGGIR